MIITRDRRESLLRTLSMLRGLPERPPVVVVDNGSADGTAEAVRRQEPEVTVLEPGRNLASAGRNAGAREAGTRYVAFSDDDSWWAAGSLERAAGILDAHPRVAVLVARALVGSEEREDPLCAELAASRLPAEPGLPGPSVLGFLACAAVVRRSAFLEVGGFSPRFGVGGEEELLALDLAAAGWRLAYVDSVVAHHHPGAGRPPGRRQVLQLRNALWVAWLRRPAVVAVRRTWELLRRAPAPGVAVRGLAQALGGLGWALRERRVLPPEVEAAVRLLEQRPPPG